MIDNRLLVAAGLASSGLGLLLAAFVSRVETADPRVHVIAEVAEVAVRCLENRSDYDAPTCWDDLTRCESLCQVRWDEPTIYGDIMERLDDCQRATSERDR